MASRNERRRRRSRPPTWASTAMAGPVQYAPLSRWRPGYWLRHPAFAALLAVSFGVLTFGACGIGELREARAYQERGAFAAGVVVEARESQRRSLLRVEFTTAQGERVVARVVGPPEDLPTPGDRVTVVYDPEDLDDVHLGDKPSGTAGWLILATGLLATASYLAYLRWSWHRWRNQAERWRHRRPVPRLGERQDPWGTEQRDDSLS